MNSRNVARRFVRLGAVVCAWAVTAACAAQAPAAESESRTSSPKQIFERACAKCHGAEGHGGLPMVAGGPTPRDFRDAAWQASRSDGEVLAAIRDGRGAMPSFRDVLTEQEQDAAVNYVRAIGSSHPPAKEGR